MSITTACPKCGKKYQVADHLAGKQARCQQCSTLFSVAAALPQDPLAGLPLAPVNPLGTLPASTHAPASRAEVSNPSGGPNDTTMRIASAFMIVMGLILFVANLVMDQTQGAIYIAPLLLAPIALILGIAGVINPNVVRAAGKYGGHLPWQYKAIGLALVGLSLLVTLALVIGVVASGYRP